jgi:hypothetical protein
MWPAKPLRFGSGCKRLLVQAYSNSNSTPDANSANPHWQGVYLSDVCNAAVAIVAIKTFADH